MLTPIQCNLITLAYSQHKSDRGRGAYLGKNRVPLSSPGIDPIFFQEHVMIQIKIFYNL
jgi:hypothetical protein